jgi:uncharacterized protein YicC (UPF0701 family)
MITLYNNVSQRNKTMPTVFLSARIPDQLHDQLETLVSRTGVIKTSIVTKAIAACLGIEARRKAAGDRRTQQLKLRVEKLEKEVQELRKMVTNLCEKIG